MQNENIEYCPLCHCSGIKFYGDIYFICGNCSGIFRGEKFLPGRQEEKKRYEEHNNDVLDVRYQQFVSPITRRVQKDYPPDSLGLDFGSGTGPVISKILKEKNYSIIQYDPIFENKPDVLQLKYDYIVCCEVMEHFHFPEKEFILFKKLLKPQGHLYCMTHLYEPETDFGKWYYKNDHTHVFFYQKKTLEWIKLKFNFSGLEIDSRLIIFTNYQSEISETSAAV